MKKLIVEIEKLDHFGRGIARFDGKTLFIENALIGEEVEIEILKEKKNIIEGKVVRYLKESKLRIDSDCPHYEICGGCDLMHIDYNNQLSYKEDKVKEILKKFADLDSVENIVPTNQYNYRNKVTLQVKEDIGFYKKKSYEIIAVDNCLISDKRINKIIKLLRTIDIHNIKQIVIRVTNKESMIVFYSDGKIDIDIERFKDVTTIVVITNNKVILKGKGYIEQELNGLKFVISPTSFFQVNYEGMENIYNKVLEYGKFTEKDNVLDLYCGTGTIGIYLAKSCGKVLGIEINEEAVNDANINKKINAVDNIEFKVGDAGKVLEKTNFKPTAIVVDPPRSGLDSKTIEKIIDLNPNKLIYVSCDPVTLARDLNILKNSFDILEVTPFDMFPNTHHVECVALLYIKNTNIKN